MRVRAVYDRMVEDCAPIMGARFHAYPLQCWFMKYNGPRIKAAASFARVMT